MAEPGPTVPNPLPPSDKSPAIENYLEQTSGRTSAINARKCIPAPLGCGRDIEPGEIETWDSLTVREYQISGLCKTCQDSVFGTSEEDEEEPPREPDPGFEVNDYGSMSAYHQGPYGQNL
jgi:hypothetical protein